MSRTLLLLVTIVIGWPALPVARSEPQPSARPATEKVSGLAEWRQGSILVVDGQRIALSGATKMTGRLRGGIAAIPLGAEVSARGTRQPDGSLLASEVDARPNGSGVFDEMVKSATDGAEAEWLQKGRIGEGAGDEAAGAIVRTGQGVDRVRSMIGRLAPPYRDPSTFRAYLVDHQDWNAMAMGNGAVWVFSGLLKDMDDDELAVVVGHEMAHVTHEHTRREFRRGMWLELLVLGVSATAEAATDNRTKAAIVQLAALFSASLWQKGYSRDLEDQADRVGLRYAYQAGYDIRKAPHLWERFGAKYGSENKVVNFLMGDHSTVNSRIANLRRELTVNYRVGER